jgi:hypothetical protein
MSQDMAHELVARTPTYEFRSAGKLCTALRTDRDRGLELGLSG